MEMSFEWCSFKVKFWPPYFEFASCYQVFGRCYCLKLKAIIDLAFKGIGTSCGAMKSDWQASSSEMYSNFVTFCLARSDYSYLVRSVRVARNPWFQDLFQSCQERGKLSLFHSLSLIETFWLRQCEEIDRVQICLASNFASQGLKPDSNARVYSIRYF